ncbi:MAG: MmgE/PrpD family protein [Gammaproteobacteria bacterium]|nr:MmgE/PrpD family protein [Gammaproteobacteria bacterium]
MTDTRSETQPHLAIDRRTLLGGAAALLVSATVRAGEPNRLDDDRRLPNPASGESRALAAYVANTGYDALPGVVRTMTQRSVLDALGVSMAAAGLEAACQPFIDTASEVGGNGAARIIGAGGRGAAMPMAALANGALAHALDYEDAHDPSRTHPNAATVAAAITIADATGGISGREFMLAVALGCDITCRLSMAKGKVDELPTAYYPPAIAGTFGAAAAAARLLKLNPEQTLNAFSLALCQNSCSAEILFDPYSDVRAVRDGFCAQAGVQAAMLARHGVKGFQAPFEGKGGFFSMYGDGRYHAGMLADRLGVRFAGADVGFKAWPACRDNHLYIQAALEGNGRDRLVAGDIKHIRAFVKERNLIVCEPAAEKREPRAPIDAKFSLYFTVAAAAIHGRINLASYTPDALQDTATLALAQRIEYERDDNHARLERNGEGLALQVTLNNGRVIDWVVGPLYGSPSNPMSEKALVEKFVDCAAAARQPLAPAEANQLAQTLLNLEAVSDMRQVTHLL